MENQSGFLVPEFQEAYLKLHKKPLPILHELNSWEFIAKSMEYQKGYGLLPDFITKQKRYADFIAIPAPSLPYTIHAVFHKGRALSYSAMTFLELFRQSLA